MFHVNPSSVDTSTPPIAPPPFSEHVPEIIMGLPGTEALCTGLVMIVVGARLSVEGTPATISTCLEPASAPISYNILYVAC